MQRITENHKKWRGRGLFVNKSVQISQSSMIKVFCRGRWQRSLMLWKVSEREKNEKMECRRIKGWKEENKTQWLSPMGWVPWQMLCVHSLISFSRPPWVEVSLLPSAPQRRQEPAESHKGFTDQPLNLQVSFLRRNPKKVASSWRHVGPWVGRGGWPGRRNTKECLQDQL